MADFVKEIVDLNEAQVISMLNERLAKNEDPMAIMADVRVAMKEIGELYATNVYFLPDLIMSGEILRQIFELIVPKIKEAEKAEKKGKILLVTVEGDIHDIGKDIVKFLLDVNGYDVLDLGVDVPAKTVVDKIKEFKLNIVALSGFLTIAFDAMKVTIEKISQAGLRDTVKIMIGGGVIDEKILEYTGADAYGETAMDAVTIANEWMGVES
ncbi:MAG: cobalamin B12-binding domain-containing protein [Candidatus Helarchaeota archaeon]